MVHSDDGFATVAYLRVRKASLVPKPVAVYTVAVPPLLDNKYVTMAVDLNSHLSLESNVHASAPDIYDTSLSSTSRGPWVSISNIQRSSGSRDAFAEMTIEDEVTECFGIMKGDIKHTIATLLNLCQDYCCSITFNYPTASSSTFIYRP